MTNDPRPPGWKERKLTSIPRNQVSSKARTALNVAQFDELIKQQGVRVNVYRTVFCPNVKSIDGAEHEISCPICRGSGFLDIRPIETWMGFASAGKEAAPTAEGLVEHSSPQATFLSGIQLQYFSLIEIIDHVDIYFERVKRQASPVDVLKYKALQVNIVMDANGREYFIGNDFDLDVNGSVRWKPGRGPDTGVIYSINYTMPLQYRAVRALKVNRFAQVTEGAMVTFVKAQELWALEKVFLADRTTYKGAQLAPNLIRDPDQE